MIPAGGGDVIARWFVSDADRIAKKSLRVPGYEELEIENVTAA